MKRLAAAAGVALAALAGGLWLADRLLPPDLARYHDRSVAVLDRDGEILRAFATGEGYWRLPATVDRVDPRYLAMLETYEDRRFRWHPGVDPVALARATAQAIRHGRIVSGGSTLTMQVARLLEPRPRTIGAKLIEMARALQLEWRYGKDEILAIYLTLAPFGGNLEGVRAASLAYFGKEPGRLSQAESALLVALPQSPTALRPDRAAERAGLARSKVLDRMQAAGLLDTAERAEADAVPPPSERLPLPFLAPHLAQRLGRGAVATVRTSIDGRLQRRVEALAAAESLWFDDGAAVAAIVVETRGRRVRAWLGSSGFDTPAGQIDLARRARSPGSTLKPFVYGIGFDDLAIHPETLIDDRPMRFRDYAPQNFDRGFQGTLTVRRALQQSLNLPAVAVLDRVGPARFAAELNQAGAHLSWQRPGQVPGLPMILGGVGMTLADLTMLYAALADGGKVLPLAFQDGAATLAPGRMLSETAAWYLTEILAGTPRPDGMAMRTGELGERRIAYKTGTSYGFRDAWAIGYSGSHVIGVWVGRADGSPRPGSYGRNTAAPILFKLFDLLPGQQGLPQRPAPGRAIDAASTARLPQGLKRFQATPSMMWQREAEAPPRILFPPDGAEVELTGRSGRLDTLLLQAEGGRAPLRWLVNGQPLAVSSLRADAFWEPDGAGFARVTVIDAADRSASATVRVK